MCRRASDESVRHDDRRRARRRADPALGAGAPRLGVLEASRRLGVARGTVQARLDRLRREGVVTGFGPDVDPAALGYVVTGTCWRASTRVRMRICSGSSTRSSPTPTSSGHRPSSLRQRRSPTASSRWSAPEVVGGARPLRAAQPVADPVNAVAPTSVTFMVLPLGSSYCRDSPILAPVSALPMGEAGE